MLSHFYDEGTGGAAEPKRIESRERRRNPDTRAATGRPGDAGRTKPQTSPARHAPYVTTMVFRLAVSSHRRSSACWLRC